MSNPNLNTGKEFPADVDKEFENNIRPKEINEFADTLDNYFKNLIKCTIDSNKKNQYYDDRTTSYNCI